MESKRLFKKGEITESATGEKLLINDDGTAYAATDAILAIWDSFQGNTVQEVAEELAVEINRSPDELVESVNQVATDLEKADLLHS